MPGRHVKNLLSGYCNRETGTEESRRVAEHLLVCPSCREEYEQIKLGVRLAEQLEEIDCPPELSADEIWNQIRLSLEASPAPTSPYGRRIIGWLPLSGRGLAVAGVLLLVCMVTVLALLSRRGHNRGGWVVDRLAGAPLIGSVRINGQGERLNVGQWMETDQNSRATLHPGNIGEVEVEPDSRLRLLRSEQDEYRLSLERGEVRARISAPPRLFFVDTPSAVAVDLGCAYTLHVDDSGEGRIEVTAGMVEFVSNGKKSVIPAEAECITRPGVGPGTPFFEDAPEALKQALAKVDFSSVDQRGGSLADVLASARKRDSLTLWNLLSHVEGKDRERVYRRLAGLVPPPQEVTLSGIMNLDSKMLDLWFMEVEPAWFE
jgi:hypothetical protein